jgi:hypothetical protein
VSKNDNCTQGTAIIIAHGERRKLVPAGSNDMQQQQQQQEKEREKEEEEKQLLLLSEGEKCLQEEEAKPAAAISKAKPRLDEKGWFLKRTCVGSNERSPSRSGGGP